MGPQSPCAQGVRGGAGPSASLPLLRDDSHHGRRGASRPTPRRHERDPCHYSDTLLGARMANVRDYRTRIRSVRSTQQITRAMKMVSAAKLRRAQDRILAARPYARKMLEVLSSLAARVHPEMHPLLRRRPEEKVLVIVITADKGLCGSFNTNILNRARVFLDELT